MHIDRKFRNGYAPVRPSSSAASFSVSISFNGCILCHLSSSLKQSGFVRRHSGYTSPWRHWKNIAVTRRWLLPVQEKWRRGGGGGWKNSPTSWVHVRGGSDGRYQPHHRIHGLRHQTQFRDRQLLNALQQEDSCGLRRHVWRRKGGWTRRGAQLRRRAKCC